MSDGRGDWSLRYRRIGGAVDSEHAFRAVFGTAEHSFWLDSSLVEPGRSRFSFLGDCGGPEGELLRYRVSTGVVEVIRESRPTTLIEEPIFDVIQQRLGERAVEPVPEMPFDLDCGYVGYLGYEVKADCGSPNRHVSPQADALWIAATRMIAIDHLEGETWLVALCGPGTQSERSAEDWLAQSRARLSWLWAAGDHEIAPAADQVAPAAVDVARAAVDDFGLPLDLEAWLVRPRDRYLADIAICQERLRAGDSYEICLTDAVELPFRGDPLELYSRQRRANPAPHAAYLRLPDVAVLCSSPERFLRVDRDGLVESKPIKGTVGRHASERADATAREKLASSAKNRAENLMIVDLMRSDLGRVCEIGTVSVPSLMAVESYATVHQLVSTVHGRLREDVDAVGAVRACFPGGSMTGAPKRRTIEIIDSLETRARGIYSGAIGYFGLGGGADLNIVIRTIVIAGGRLSVGAGGAIVLDSDPEEELEEMLLKARAPLALLPGGFHTSHRPIAVSDPQSVRHTDRSRTVTRSRPRSSSHLHP